MKIALIGLGRTPIPAPDMGSIENIIWNYKHYLEEAGHQVDIYNSIWIHENIYEINQGNYDFVHLHSDLHTLALNKHLVQPYCLTSHSGAFSGFIPGGTYYPAFNYLFEDSLEARGTIVLSDHIKELYLQAGYKGFLRVLRNPIETERFAFKPTGNGKALYLGRIQPRKRQAIIAKMLRGKVQMDFAGPWDRAQEPNFRENETCKYLGNLDKEVLYEKLTDYSCLVLCSRSEADPLVVKEALAAGLSLVISESCSANLTPQPFITLIPDLEEDADKLSSAILLAIKNNDGLRESAKSYAQKRFDYRVVLQEYLQTIQEFQQTVQKQTAK